MAESHQSCLYHKDDQIKEPKPSAPHHTSASGEQYAVSFNAVNSVAEKQQQQQVPLEEYAEIDNNKNNSPQQYNVTSGYDMIKDNGNTDSKEVSLHYIFIKYICTCYMTSYLAFKIRFELIATWLEKFSSPYFYSICIVLTSRLQIWLFAPWK